MSYHRPSFLALTGLLISACAQTPLPVSDPKPTPTGALSSAPIPETSSIPTGVSSAPPSSSPSVSPLTPSPSALSFEAVPLAANQLVTVQGSLKSLRFQIAGSNLSLKPRQQLCLAALALDASGQPLDTSPVLDWSSSQAEIATVDANGCVKSLQAGQTLIQAALKSQPELKTQLTLEVKSSISTTQAQAGFDFNGDGHQDYLVSAGKKLRLYLGEGKGFNLNELKPENSTAFQFPNVLNASTKPAFGTHTATGDLNGDGFDDLAIAHAYFGPLGAIDVYFGSAYPRSFYNLAAPDLTIRPQPGAANGLNYYDQLGRDVIIRDLDGDGMAELITGNPAFQTNGGVHIFKGQPKWPDKLTQREASFNLTGLPHQDRRSLVEFGKIIASGDFNGDRQPDLAVAAPTDGVVGPYDAKGSQQIIDVGRIFIYFGDAKGWQNKTAAQASLSIKGLVSPDLNEFIHAMQVQDLNGDGRDELIVQGVQRSVDPVQVLNPATEMLQDVVHFRSAGHVFYAEQLNPGAVLSLTQASVNFGASEEDYQSRLIIADLNQDGKPDLGLGEAYSLERSGLGIYSGRQLTAGAQPARSGSYLLSDASSKSWPSLLALETGANSQKELYIADDKDSSSFCLARLPMPSGLAAAIPTQGYICLP